MKAALSRRDASDDTELLRAIADGHLTALGALYDLYEPDVRRVVVRLGVRDSDVDDVIHATFLQVARAAKRFDELRGSVRGWLLGVAANVVRRHRRSFARTARRLLAWANEPNSRTPAVDETFERRQELERLERAIDALSPAKREALVLVALEGLSAQTAAASLGVPVGTVWTRLHHARRELRRAMEEP